MQCSGRCGDGGHVVCRDGGRIVDPCDGLDGWSYIELNVVVIVMSGHLGGGSLWGVVMVIVVVVQSGGCHSSLKNEMEIIALAYQFQSQ